MSEKRFYITDTGLGLDTESDEMYSFGDEEDFCRLFDKLNEQQATIRKLQDLCGESDSENAKLRLKNKELQEEIKLLKPVNIEQYEQIVQLQEMNEQLRKQVESSETTSNATSHYNAFLESKITTLEKDNEKLNEELQRFKKYVFSQDNILCYKCEHCIKKDIYVVDCEMKGEVDVHGLCGWFREVKV